ncbi:cysteinyl-tRNA synthetase [Halalkaliarchaeum desulfuricum]|uniref:Cysteine--tRNA ligase n=1 Tax=Halalkaliarchaeum desulfuricum TaxID=2055893 RepID=A0A343TFX4_9EURY|nr:cysteine--tRNA ligase [Halalkaliarchaeum desulfuricum]AUX07996.1 cysteinyl-tRNA synthetase [Halalkaliarchaeum desulfuricum]
MTLSVTNTLSGEREAFEVDDGEVLLYVCGLTVSDDAHLGHARAWVHADIIHRWLEYLGYDVRHVENVTDVNEKITARAGERDDWDTEADVARHFTADIFEDMRGLNLLRAEVYPRVSEHVPEIIDLVETLVDRGYAYESNGSVYFDVTQFESYGDLSNQELEELEAQGEPDERSEKRHPADFALWKADGVSESAVREHRKHEHEGALPTGQTWDSPWSDGRPGWHVECSAMSMTHLGETIDVHMGGRDLVFPHHENEIAQSEAATGEEFVRYWLHNGLLETEGEKMSSSLGNYWTVSDALEKLGVNVVRTFYAGAQYRTDQALSEDALEEAEERFERLQRAYETAVAAADSVDAVTKAEDEALRDAVEATRTEFEAAMNDDFNVREATAAILDLAAAVNRHVESNETYDYPGLRRSIETLETFGEGVLGLQFDAVDDGDATLAGELVELVLEIREQERQAGNYERADQLRDALDEAGIEVEDAPDGPTYRFE